jgi:hypothetical protein
MAVEMEVRVDTDEARRLEARLKRLGPGGQSLLTQHSRRAFLRIKNLAVADAKKNAPISPTKAQHEATLVGRKRGGTEGSSVGIRFGLGKPIIESSTLRSVRTDFAPGQLTSNITGEIHPEGVRVFVPSNSTAGAYATYIHDGGPNGTGAWKKRGVGTVAKGSRATDKFIERAIRGSNEAVFIAIYEQELGKALAEWEKGAA